MLGLLGGAGALMALVWGVLWPFSVAVLTTPLFGLSYRGDSTDYDPWTGTLSISGYLSPGFRRTVATYMHGRPIRRVEVSIAGGLLEDALFTAQEIEKRRFVTVVARKTCDHACIVILLAGDERLAQYDMSLKLGGERGGGDGFDTRVWRPEEKARMLAERTARLRASGVPERLIAPAGTTINGEEDGQAVSAIELARAGVLTGLVDNQGHRISLKEAEARLARE